MSKENIPTSLSFLNRLIGLVLELEMDIAYLSCDPLSLYRFELVLGIPVQRLRLEWEPGGDILMVTENIYGGQATDSLAVSAGDLLGTLEPALRQRVALSVRFRPNSVAQFFKKFQAIIVFTADLESSVSYLCYDARIDKFEFEVSNGDRKLRVIWEKDDQIKKFFRTVGGNHPTHEVINSETEYFRAAREVLKKEFAG